MASNHSGPAFVRLHGQTPDAVALQLLPEEQARKFQAIPLWLEDNQLVIACLNSDDQEHIRQIQIYCRRPVRPLPVHYSELRDAYSLFYHNIPPRPALDRPTLSGILHLLGILDPDQVRRLNSAIRASGQIQAGDPDDGHGDLEKNRDPDGVAAARACRKLGLAEPAPLAEALGLLYDLPHLSTGGPDPSPELAVLIAPEVVLERGILPLWWINGTLVVGIAGATSLDCLADLDALVGAPVQPVVCPENLWNRYYRRMYLSAPTRPPYQEQEALKWLVQHDRLTALDVQAARAAAQQSRRSVQEILVENDVIQAEEWQQAVSSITGIPFDAPKISSENAGFNFGKDFPIPIEIARRLGIAPIRMEGEDLILGMTRPNPLAVQLVHLITGHPVQPRLVRNSRLEELQARIEQPRRKDRLRAMPRLGDLLVKLKIITPDQLDEALDDIENFDHPIGERLVRRGYLDEDDLAEMLGLQTGMPSIRLDHTRFDPSVVAQIPPHVARKHRMIPIWSGRDELWIATADPLDYAGLIAVERASGKRVRPVIAPSSAVSAAIERLTGRKDGRSIPTLALAVINRLVEKRYLNQIEAAQVLKRYSDADIALDEAVLQETPIWDVEIVRTFGELLKLPVVSLEIEERKTAFIDPLGQPVERIVPHDPVDAEAAVLIDQKTAQRLSAIPIQFEGERLQVAFADPLYEAALQELSAALRRTIIPVLTPRSELNNAIQRHLGRRNIGTHLLLAGEITRSQLNDALNYARRTGVRLGHAIVNRGYMTWPQFYRQLAYQANMPFMDLETAEIDPDLARSIDPGIARQSGFLPLRQEGGRIVVAVVDPLDESTLDAAREALEAPITPALVTENDLDAALEQLYRQEYLDRSISELLERAPEDSAYRVLSRGQIVVLLAFLIGSAVWLFLDRISYWIVLNSFITAFYIAISAYKLYLIYHALSHDLEVPVTAEDLDALNDRDLPVYTILIPVYREAEVLVELLNAIRRLDYPQTKLDIKILMEADDEETIRAFHEFNPPSHFHGVIVPYGQPKTKPKACNYGLIHARGDYVVIFDAEDLPDPDQLKKAVVAFEKTNDPRVVCIQSKLNYYNRDQNFLTRWFTVEYSMWFDLFLPGLDRSGAPIPLGGTSNHFRREALIEVGAWDPYNVTEDADLGMRLFKRGYRTAIVDSTTYEEATSQIFNWIRQRSRWVKGYIQTWLVHMRSPRRLIREIGLKPFLAFQMVIGGTFFAALINPIYWLLTTVWFLFRWEVVQQVFPGIVFYFGALSLFIGNFAFTYMNVAGAMRRGYYGMVKYALLTPLYWGLTSIGAWKGFLQLITRPHFWEKTQHGHYDGEPVVEASPPPVNDQADDRTET